MSTQFSLSFRTKLLRWGAENKRNFPWMEDPDPYKIWLFEIIMQQTRLEQGMPYYERFIKAYPEVGKLAAAKESDVLKLWEGLGYYSRARNLHHTAKVISTNYGGKFPSSYKDILGLKGIGPYTAAAISSFAYGLPHAVLDGNVIRVISRYFGIQEAVNDPKTIKSLQKIAEECLDQSAPGQYNQVIMDFGATACTPKTPFCEGCVLNSSCFAHNNEVVDVLPYKKKKAPLRKRYFNYLVYVTPKGIPVVQRQDNDIWKKLYQFPLLEKDQLIELAELPDVTNGQKWKQDDVYVIDDTTILSHQKIYLRYFILPLENVNVGGRLVKLEKLSQLAFPRPLRLFIKQNLLHLEKGVKK